LSPLLAQSGLRDCRRFCPLVSGIADNSLLI
jgi:hypothetical protein